MDDGGEAYASIHPGCLWSRKFPLLCSPYHLDSKGVVFHHIAIYRGLFVNTVYIIHIVRLGLHPVAPDMKQGKATRCSIISKFDNKDQEYIDCETCQSAASIFSKQDLTNTPFSYNICTGVKVNPYDWNKYT